jgi:hypothetical protein
VVTVIADESFSALSRDRMARHAKDCMAFVTPSQPSASNVHPRIVQERLGHASIAITLNLYSHSVRTMQSRYCRTAIVAKRLQSRENAFVSKGRRLFDS